MVCFHFAETLKPLTEWVLTILNSVLLQFGNPRKTDQVKARVSWVSSFSGDDSKMLVVLLVLL